MAFLRSLLIAGFILNITKNYSFALINYRLPENITVPQNYNISLKLQDHNDFISFEGKLTADILVIQSTRNISLHIHKLIIIDNVDLTDVNYISIKSLSYSIVEEQQMVIFYFAYDIYPGRYILKVKYYGLSNEVTGFLRHEYSDEHKDTVSVLMTYLRPIEARSLFPCWDEPIYKAKFKLSIFHSIKYKAFSNMMMEVQTFEKNGKVWTHFETTPVMSTYQLAIVLTDFFIVPCSNTICNHKMSMLCRSQVAHQVKLAQSISDMVVDYLVQYTNKSMEISKTYHIGIPNLTDGSMGKWGLNIYKEQDLAYDESLDLIYRKINISTAVAWQMAHHWFGNLVSPSWWNHLWLIKTLSTFFGNYFLSKIYNDLPYFFLFHIQQFAFRSDHANYTITSETISSPNDINKHYSLIYSSACCLKATALILMLQYVITEDVFQEGIKKYLDKHQFSTVTPDDLWNALENALNESGKARSNFRIKTVMNTWLTQRNYPVVNVKRHENTIVVTQENVHANEDGDMKVKWWIPITYVKRSFLHSFDSSLITWLNPQNEKIVIKDVSPDDWIVVNLKRIGYYRVNYDFENWRKIVRFLRSSEYKRLHVLNRAQIIDDAYYFVVNKKLHPSIFWELINYLQVETEFIPLYSMDEILMNITTLFKFPESKFIKSHMVQILDNLTNYVVVNQSSENDDNIKLKRIFILEWACQLENSVCRSFAHAKLNYDSKSFKIQKKLFPWWESWTPCIAMMNADKEIWDTMYNKFVHTKDKRILEYMTCPEASHIIKNYLSLLMKNCTATIADSLINWQDCGRIYHSIIKKHIHKDIVLYYVLSHFEKLKPINMTFTEALADIITNLYSKPHILEVTSFVRNTLKKQELNVTYLEDLMIDQWNMINEKVKFIELFKTDEDILSDKN